MSLTKVGLANAEPGLASTRTLNSRRSLGALDRLLASRLQRRLDGVAIRLELWDGSSPYTLEQPPLGSLIVSDRRTVLGLITNPGLYFGECYMAGRLHVVGTLEPVLEALTRLDSLTPTWRDRLMTHLAVPNTVSASRRNVHRHYDLGNDFYRSWLDQNLVYTCAYFPDPAMSLEDAQRAKLDLVCRKVALRPGDTVVEAGCGWGALALHMARHYGAHVKAFNISREQISYARECAAREGLSGQVEFIDDDYRNVTGQFDAFVSVGMLEHVGRHQLRALATVLQRSVRRDGGRGLLHFIGRDVSRPLNAWIRRRIFPGAYIPTLGEVTDQILRPAGMSAIDVENLRLHYARTLAHWGHRFALASNDVRARYGDAFRRAWELYLAGSEAAFATGWLQLFQVVFSPTEGPPPFWTRESVYDRKVHQCSAVTR
jgi:cyclopropane-fatty-acyl-phospholipid synthase